MTDAQSSTTFTWCPRFLSSSITSGRKSAFQSESPVGLIDQVPARKPARRLDGGLNVQAEIEDAGHHLDVRLRLAVRPAGAEDHEGLSSLEGHGGHQGVKSALMGLKAVHMVRVQGKVGSPVLQNDSRFPRDHGRAEGEVKRLDQRDGITRFIDDAEVDRIPAEVSRAKWPRHPPPGPVG